MDGVGGKSSVETVNIGIAGERLRAGPASGEDRNGFVLATWLSADFGRGFVMGGMSRGTENLLVSFSMVFGLL